MVTTPERYELSGRALSEATGITGIVMESGDVVYSYSLSALSAVVHAACIPQTGLYKGQQPGKETREEIRKAMGRKRSKNEKMEVVLFGPPWPVFARRVVQLQPRFKQQK